jgi:MYXO-CTERM domain-containing protein
MNLARLFVGVSMSIGLLGAARSAEAGALNNNGCKPAPGQYPVVVLHGQGGSYTGMTAITDALVRDGYCVFAKDYGFESNAYGRQYLDVSGKEIRAQVDDVLRSTGAAKINIVSYSAGVGVQNNFILGQGGASQVNRAIGIAGLHHPYAHLGLAQVADADLYLPNLIGLVRGIVPGVTTKSIISLIRMGADAIRPFFGEQIKAMDPWLDIAECGFVSDMFDPSYWLRLHGQQSEDPTTFIRFQQAARTMKTKDNAPNVCYTNIVSPADLLAGTAAGFQDEAPNVDNVVLLTGADHVGVTSDPQVLAKMSAALGSPCNPPPVSDSVAVSGAGENEQTLNGGSGHGDSDDSDDEITPPRSSGCSVTHTPTGSSAGAITGLLLAAVAFLRRRR